MDLGRIKAYGRSTTRTAWVTNPLRALAWRLVAPYFRGAGVEAEQRVDAVSAEIGQRLQADVAGNRAASASAVTSYLAGARKDAMAMAHRLAGLEEEAAAHARALADLTGRLDAAALVGRDDAQSVTERDILVLAATKAGAQFLVRPHDLIGRWVAGGQEWEPHVRAAIEGAARQNGVAVDAGAYIGLHTVTMSRNFGAVHAFEPQMGIYRLLRANLAMNFCGNVTTHNLALYDRAGAMRLAPPDRQEVATPLRDGQPDYARIDNAAALTFEMAGGGDGEVHAMALDDLALERVALIKVDTQGADLRVLRGAIATIRRCRPLILFEWERDLGAQHGTVLADIQTFFADLDYDIVLLQETSPERQADYLARPR